MSTRSELLQEYAASTAGRVIEIDGRYGGQSPDLVNDYLRFITCEPGLHIPGNAIDWAIASEELHPAQEALLRIADYTNAYPGRHAPVTQPEPGDVMVFAGPPGNPYGGLGIYLTHHDGNVVVYTQGQHNGQTAPAQYATARGDAVRALGWWHVRDEHVRRRLGPWATARQEAS